ncbi:MAG: hypothetical protein A2Y10_01205 [Planctomycetes bacterium GWF2_41_51]|nr:MAG: hypothetical protein A2Y10_01205 [Planctomycetes bacterium GWF2_41_51]HBG25620.1 hypothetical protein [Phycisphaerales bacterium]
MKNRTKDKGFTLVELLVVISIIALLLSILIPSLNRARKQSQKIVCGTRMKQTGISQIAWSMDHGGYATPLFEKWENYIGGGAPGSDTGLLWTEMLIKGKYAMDMNFFRCPIGNPNQRTIENKKIPLNHQTMFTYALCRGLSTWDPWRIDTGRLVRKDGHGFDGKDLKSMKTSEFILGGDSVNLYPPYIRPYGPEMQFYYFSPFTENSYDKLALRHLKTGQFLMADGSVANKDRTSLLNKHHVVDSAIHIITNN